MVTFLSHGSLTQVPNPNRRRADSAQPPWRVKKLELLLQGSVTRRHVSGASECMCVVLHRVSPPKGESAGPATACLCVHPLRDVRENVGLLYWNKPYGWREYWKDSFHSTRLPHASQELSVLWIASCIRPNKLLVVFVMYFVPKCLDF